MDMELRRRKTLGAMSIAYVGWVLLSGMISIVALQAPVRFIVVVVTAGMVMLLGGAVFFGGPILARIPTPSGESARMLRLAGYVVYPGFLLFLVVNALPLLAIESSFFVDSPSGPIVAILMSVSLLLYIAWAVAFARWHSTIRQIQEP